MEEKNYFEMTYCSEFGIGSKERCFLIEYYASHLNTWALVKQETFNGMDLFLAT